MRFSKILLTLLVARQNHLNGWFLTLCVKILGPGGHLRIVLYHYMNADSVVEYHEVVGTFKSLWKRICLNFLHSQVRGGVQAIIRTEPPGENFTIFI